MPRSASDRWPTLALKWDLGNKFNINFRHSEIYLNCC